MNLKPGFILFFCIVGCISFGWRVGHSAEIDPYPNVIIPIFKEGYNLQKDFNAAKAIKSIRYYVQTGSPPAEVLEFYDAYFNGKGWRSTFEICQRNWESIGEESDTTGPLLKQLFAGTMYSNPDP